MARKVRVGATLAEILIALSVLVPVIVVMVGVFPYSYLNTRRAGRLTAAYDLGRAQLEALRATEFDRLPDELQVVRDVEGTRFTCLVRCGPVDGLEPTGIKNLTVSVTWDDGKPQRLSFETMSARTE